MPHLFIQAGAARWDDPGRFPWTMPLANLLRSEAMRYARYIMQVNPPDARIAVLYQNDDFGKDYLGGLTEGLGAQAAGMIVATAAYEASDPTIDTQIVSLRSSGADVLLIAASPKFAAQAIRRGFDIDWHPTRFVAKLSSSVTGVLTSAGLDKSEGVVTTTSFKAVGDPQWANDPDYRAWLEFMRAYFRARSTTSSRWSAIQTPHCLSRCCVAAVMTLHAKTCCL